MRIRPSLIATLLLLAFLLGPIPLTGHSLPLGVCGDSVLLASGGTLSLVEGTEAVRFEAPDRTRYRIGDPGSAPRDCTLADGPKQADVLGWIRPCEAPLGNLGVPLDPWIIRCEIEG